MGMVGLDALHSVFSRTDQMNSFVLWTIYGTVKIYVTKMSLSFEVCPSAQSLVQGHYLVIIRV